jgi:hypothetical protein
MCFGELVLIGGIILKQILNKYGVKVVTGFSWLRIVSGVKLL